MGVFDKVKFWKKDDDFNVPGANDQPPAYDLGSPQHFDPLARPDPLGSQQDSFGHEGFPTQEQNQTPNYPSYPASAPFPGMTQRSVPEPQYQEQQEQNPQGGIHQRDVELILAKLDAVKSELDALHQRVKKIEQVTDAQQQQQTQKKYW